MCRIYRCSYFFEKVFRILGGASRPQSAKISIDIGGGVQKYPETIKSFDTPSNVGRQNSKVAVSDRQTQRPGGRETEGYTDVQTETERQTARLRGKGEEK